MTSNCLGSHSDHMCWQQRVEKQQFAQKRYQENLRRNGNANGYSPLRRFVRLNADQNALKKSNFYMIDSSYVVASDPNSMRDNGPSRNAQYYFPLENLKTEENYDEDQQLDAQLPPEGSQTERDHSPSVSAFQRFVTPDLYGKTGSIYNRSSSPFMRTALAQSPGLKPRMNQMFYTFGAKTNIKEAAHHSSAATPHSQKQRTLGKRPGTADIYNSTLSLPNHSPHVVTVTDPNVERRDYTKNLSQQIFFPGMTTEQFLRSASQVAKKSPAPDSSLIKKRTAKIYGSGFKSFKPLKPNAYEDFRSEISSQYGMPLQRSLAKDFERVNQLSSNTKSKKEFYHRRVNSQSVSHELTLQESQKKGGHQYLKSAIRRLEDEILQESKQRKKLQSEIRSLSHTLRSWKSQKM